MTWPYVARVIVGEWPASFATSTTLLPSAE
jgi:hypothetical protein